MLMKIENRNSEFHAVIKYLDKIDKIHGIVI